MGLQSKAENPNGLHAKYVIHKATDKEGIVNDVDPGSEFFILRLDAGADENHRLACIKGVIAYAEAIQPFIPKLADDILQKWCKDRAIPVGNLMPEEGATVEVVTNLGRMADAKVVFGPELGGKTMKEFEPLFTMKHNEKITHWIR